MICCGGTQIGSQPRGVEGNCYSRKASAHEKVSLTNFSAREVAKHIGYSIGTISDIFGSYDAFSLAINGCTLPLRRDHLVRRLGEVRQERLRAAITACFEFATTHRHSWAANYDYRLPEDLTPPERYQVVVRAISI